MQEIQSKIDALVAERTALQDGITALEGQLSEADQALTPLYVVAERQPSPEATSAVDAAEAARHGLESQLRRKRAALAAVDNDLVTQRQALATSQRAASLIVLQTLIDETNALCAQIDQMPVEPALWAELRGMVDRGQTIYTAAGGGGKLFGDIWAARERLWRIMAADCERAMGRKGDDGIKAVGVGQMMDVWTAAERVRSLL